MTLEEVEKLHLEQALDQFEGNKTAAARYLGVSVKTIYNLMRSHNVVAKDRFVGLNEELEGFHVQD